MSGQVGREIERLTELLSRLQAPDGSWRFCFENAVLTDAYMIIVLRALEIPDEPLIRLLRDRLLATQFEDGSWRAYPDEREGNLSATVECYFALLYSGYSQVADPQVAKARAFILAQGGLRNIGGLMTKVMLAVNGQYPWPRSPMIPLEVLLFPSSFPVNMFDFSGYARVHMIPALLLADRRFTIRTDRTPELSELAGSLPWDRLSFWSEGVGRDRSPALQSLLDQIGKGIDLLAGIPEQLHGEASKRAERYMLERIEPDGTFYSYASCTFLMIFALLAVGYDKRHPVIRDAVQGLRSMICRTASPIFVQNSPSAVWDTALLSYALQEAGRSSAASVMIRRSAAYLLSKQHRRPGDWSIHNPNVIPGGWGFSDSNTLNPDVDDTTAALRAIRNLAGTDSSYREAWNRGLNWLLSMQNDDGGWPSFEKNTDREFLALLPLQEAKSSAIDPSTPDLTGRTLEFLGNYAGLDIRHALVRKGADWLLDRQEKDGSWYGRWGVCYIYGTWAALTGLTAAGIPADHPSVRSGTKWLLEIRHADGGWGESCASDRHMRYIPLAGSTPSQTAWALDALISVHETPNSAIDQGIRRLIGLLREEGGLAAYPTGAGLPGVFYSHYHSYRYIWPLLALSHYRNKYSP
ncbi:squalene--hopene cyclase [Cohnella sp. CFH 77786]|nr:squalene--hopene cyclase [Cohnella sp. CFH 77786]MBW5449264.1 squalene--hopene cyclase [Cohnella sp. CFH 77786]